MSDITDVIAHYNPSDRVFKYASNAMREPLEYATGSDNCYDLQDVLMSSAFHNDAEGECPIKMKELRDYSNFVVMANYLSMEDATKFGEDIRKHVGKPDVADKDSIISALFVLYSGDDTPSAETIGEESLQLYRVLSKAALTIIDEGANDPEGLNPALDSDYALGAIVDAAMASKRRPSRRNPIDPNYASVQRFNVKKPIKFPDSGTA
jgi:hypothetical protein